MSVSLPFSEDSLSRPVSSGHFLARCCWPLVGRGAGMLLRVPTTENYPALNVNSGKMEKPCPKITSFRLDCASRTAASRGLPAPDRERQTACVLSPRRWPLEPMREPACASPARCCVLPEKQLPLPWVKLKLFYSVKFESLVPRRCLMSTRFTSICVIYQKVGIITFYT